MPPGSLSTRRPRHSPNSRRRRRGPPSPPQRTSKTRTSKSKTRREHSMALTPDEPRRVAERFPDRLALVVDNGGAMTFSEGGGGSKAAAPSLADLGVVRGDQVALLPPGEVLHRPGSVGKPIEPAAVRMVDNHRN